LKGYYFVNRLTRASNGFDSFSFAMPATKFIAVGVLFILCVSSISCQDSEEGPSLSIEPFRLTIEVGNDAVFHCIFTHTDNLTQISWFYPGNGTEVEPESNTTRIYVDGESLHIKNAQENDAGLYLCRATVGNSISTAPVVTFSTTMHGDVTVTQLPVTNSTDGRLTFATDAPSNATFAEEIPGPRQVETEMPPTYNATVDVKVYVMPTYFTEGMIILGINLGLLLIFLICLTQSLVSERKRMQTYYKK